MERFISSKVGRTTEGDCGCCHDGARLRRTLGGYPEATTKWPVVIARSDSSVWARWASRWPARCAAPDYEVAAAVHRSRDALERLRADGVSEAADPAALAAESRGRDPLRSRRAAGRGGALRGARRRRGARPGSLVIDMSTISPVASRSFAERLARTRTWSSLTRR